MAGGIAFSLIVEVRRSGIAAFTARSHRFGPHLFSEFHNGHEAVAARPVITLGSLVTARAEGGEGAPGAGREADRYAGGGIGKRLDDVARQPLEAIDLAPRCAPAAEIIFQLLH